VGVDCGATATDVPWRLMVAGSGSIPNTCVGSPQQAKPRESILTKVSAVPVIFMKLVSAFIESSNPSSMSLSL
jgi:hypothetical protein